MQTATNPQTGERLGLINGQWQKIEASATNDKGMKAYLVGGNWIQDAPQAPSQGAPSATIGERARAAISGADKGIAGLVGLPVDTAENLVNLGIAGVGTAATAFGRPDLAPDLIHGTPGGSESIRNVMGKVGISTENPRPDDAASRMLHTGGMIAGASMIPGAGVRNTVKAAVGGAVAGEMGGPEWIGVGAMTPGAAGEAAASVKNNIAANTAPNLRTFQAAGTTPSVGQATDMTFMHGLENLAAKFPGGAGVMAKFREAQQATLGAPTKTGVPAEAAGRAIESGITGEGGFLARTNATWQKLDQAVANKVPKGTMVVPANALKALDELTTPVKGAEVSTGAPLDARVAQYKDALTQDIQNNGGRISFEGLRAIRSRVGAQMDDALVQGAKSGELSKLYGALSKDIETAAQQSGAGAEFKRQNDYYRARMARVNDVLDRVLGQGKQPEDIFKSIMPTEPDQANKLRAVLRSLSPAERQTVSEAAANRLGRASPGTQDVEGTAFSSEQFLTNWMRLSNGAKAQLFPDPPLRQALNNLAEAASTIRHGKGIFANPSGTAGSFAAYGVYMAPMTALGYMVGGTPGAAGVLTSAAASAGAAHVGAKMMTNPRVVQWLATKVNPQSPSQMTAHLARLGVIYNETKDEGLRSELAQFVQQEKQ